MNLVQLALAAEKLAQETPPVTADASRCLHRWNKASTCDLCVQVCPVGAIRLQEGVQVDVDACIRCGLCLHTCPTGTFTGRNHTYRVLHCAEELVDHEVIELACQPHPSPAVGERGVDGVLVTNGCLSELGPSAYAGLLAIGVQQVRVRLDACAHCPLGMLKPHIEKTLSEVRALTGCETCVEHIEQTPATHKRPVYSIQNPPMSRRGFFRRISHQERPSAAAIVPQDSALSESPSHLPRERRWLLNALRESGAAETPVELDGFTRLAVTPDCTACGVCARVCPTDALQFASNDDHFEITFLAGACVDCGLCLGYCDVDALQKDSAPTVQELVDSTPELLYEGDLQRCSRCGAPFAGASEEGLCPVCTFRRNHPFGAPILKSRF